MAKTSQKLALRRRRKRRIRTRMAGTPERPRVSVFRSARHVYAQVVDDGAGTTLASASSAAAELPALAEGVELSGKRAKAFQVGLLVAERCKAAGIERIVFDRNGFLYHGRVRSLAEGIRHGGIEF